MRFSPSGRRVLGGIGAGHIYVDGTVPDGLRGLTGGSWDWITEDIIGGNGTLDGQSWRLWRYTLSTSELATLDPRGSTAFYGGGGRWLAYLASNPPQNYDSDGREWGGLVARGMSPHGTAIYTTPENDGIVWQRQSASGEIQGTAVESIQIGDDDAILWAEHGRLRSSPAATPACPQSGGLGARFARSADGSACLAQWNAGLGALVVYPWQAPDQPLMGYVLSTDEHDFNHDIAFRDDGMLVVATGVNQGETASRLYELDLTAKRWRVNDGAWQALKLVDMNAAAIVLPDPIVAIGRACFLAWFTFRDEQTQAPQNARLAVPTTLAQRMYLKTADSRIIARYVSAANDSDVEQLDEDIANARKAEPTVPVLAYWTAQAQRERLPNGAQHIGIEAYRREVESILSYEQRLRSGIERVTQAGMTPWFIPQCYTSNINNTADLRSIPPVIARVTRDCPAVLGVLPFSGAGRPTGYQDHPEVWHDWFVLADGITGTPALPVVVTPPAGPVDPPPPIKPPAKSPAFPPIQEIRPMSSTDRYACLFLSTSFSGALFGVPDVQNNCILFNQTAPIDDCLLVVSDPLNAFNQRSLYFEKANMFACLLGAPDAPRADGFIRCFELRGVVGGPNEMPFIGTFPSPDGPIILAVPALKSNGHPYAGCGLTLVKVR